MTRQQRKELKDLDALILMHSLLLQNLFEARARLDKTGTLAFIDGLADTLRQVATNPREEESKPA